MRVKDKVAIVTGGGRSIGKAISLTLAKEGANIAIFGRTMDVVEQTAEEIRKLGRKVLVTRADVSDSSQVDQAVQKVLNEFGRIDILVNNAGISSIQNSILEVSDERWNKEIAVNLSGPFYCIRAVLKSMIEQRSGKIITIGSQAGQTGRPFSSPSYSAAKAGIVGLTMLVALSVAKYGINANVVNPGPVETNLFRKTFDSEPEKAEVICRGIPFRREGIESEVTVGTPQDIANAVLFLASNESDWITGICLNVMGGQFMKA